MNHFIFKEKFTLKGSGGGKSAQQTPPPPNVSQYPSVLAPPQFSDLNTINSFSYAEMIDLLGDGPIEGLINNNDKKIYEENIFEGIYLNDTAVKETSSERIFDLSISFIKDGLKRHWSYDGSVKDNFLKKDIPRVTVLNANSIPNKDFSRDIKITSFHPENSILEFVQSFNGSFDAISLIQRAFELSPIKNEAPFLTKINIPFFKVYLPNNIFDRSEGGDASDMPIKLKINNISNYIYFSIGPENLTSFNYFELPRTFIDNNSFLSSGKKTFKKNFISSNFDSDLYEVYDVNFYIWSIYNEDTGIKNIDAILDKYFNKITFFQNSKSLFNFNLIQSELKTGSEIQSPLKYFSNVEIDTEYNKELIGPFKITNSWKPSSALQAGGVQRLLNFAPKNYLIDSSVNVSLKDETSDDIRYIKSWPVSYDNRNRPYLICCAIANYSSFDKVSSSRVSQSEVPIVHYIENDNVEEVYVTLNIQELYDTNHIDLVSDNTSLGIVDNKNRQDFRQSDLAPTNVNTFGDIIGYSNSGIASSGVLYLLIYGCGRNDGYVLDGFRTTGNSIDAECLFCNLRRVIDKNASNTLYYKTISNDELNYLVPNLSSYISSNPSGYLATKQNNLINYLVPNDYSVVTENFCISPSTTAEKFQSKLKILNEDGLPLYCFGLLQNDIIIDASECMTSYPIAYCCSPNTLPFINQLNLTNANNNISCRFWMRPIRFLTFQAQSSNLIVGTIINNLIDWSSIFSGWNSNQVLSTNLSFRAGVSFEQYPNIFKFIINPFLSQIKIKKPSSSSVYYTLSDTSIIGKLYLIGINSDYIYSQAEYFSINALGVLSLSLNALDYLLEQFLLSSFDSSNFASLNNTSQLINIFDSVVVGAFKNKISLFENGKLIGNSNILSIDKIPIYSAMPTSSDYGITSSSGLTWNYNTNKIYLYNKQYSNLYFNKYIDIVNGIKYSYDVVFKFNIYANSNLTNFSNPNNSAKYLVGTELAEQGQDPSTSRQVSVPNLPKAKQSITAGTKLPSIIVVDVETGLESNENRNIRGSCEFFCYRYNIFGLSTGSSYIDIGRKSSDSVQGYKLSSDKASYALNLPDVVIHNGVKLYLIKLKLNERGVIKESSFLTNNKGFLFGDINLYDVDLSVRNHPTLSYIYDANNKQIGVQQRWYKDYQYQSANPGWLNSETELSFIYYEFLSDASENLLTDSELSSYFSQDYTELYLSSASTLLKTKKIIPSEFLISSSIINSIGSKGNAALNYDTYRLYYTKTNLNSNGKPYGPIEDDIVDLNYYIEAKIYNFNFSVYESATSDTTDNSVISQPVVISSSFFDKVLLKNRSYKHLLWAPGTSSFEWALKRKWKEWYFLHTNQYGAYSSQDQFKFEIISFDGFVIATKFQKDINYDVWFGSAMDSPLVDRFKTIKIVTFVQDEGAQAYSKILYNADFESKLDYSDNAILTQDVYAQIEENSGDITSRLRIKNFIGKNVIVKSLQASKNNISNFKLTNEQLETTPSAGFFDTMQREVDRLYDRSNWQINPKSPTGVYDQFWYLKMESCDEYKLPKKDWTYLTKYFITAYNNLLNGPYVTLTVNGVQKNISNVSSNWTSTVDWLTVNKQLYTNQAAENRQYVYNISANFWTLYDKISKKFIIIYNRGYQEPITLSNWGVKLESLIDYIDLPSYTVRFAWMRQDNTTNYFDQNISFRICKDGSLIDPLPLNFWLSSSFGRNGLAYCLGAESGPLSLNVYDNNQINYGNYGDFGQWTGPVCYQSIFDFSKSIACRCSYHCATLKNYVTQISYPKALYEQVNLFFTDGVGLPRCANQPETTFKQNILNEYKKDCGWMQNFQVVENVNITDYCDELKVVEQTFLSNGAISPDTRLVSYQLLPNMSKQFEKNNLIINYYANMPFSNAISSTDVYLDSGLNIRIPKATKDINGNKIRRYVKITRKSHETLSPLISKKIVLNKVTEIIPQRFSYPFSSIIGTKIDSRAFSSIPIRTYHCKLKKILVPSNYFIYNENEDDVRYVKTISKNQIYIGDWDGSFKLAWSNNPAWVLMDLLVNKRYGLGNYIESEQIDIWELYKIARWCDGVDDLGYYFGVDDGYGGIEPRHTFNAIISEKFNIFDMINQVASVFRGKVYYMNSLITFDDDRIKPVIGEFNNSDVKDGLFSYTNHKKDDEYSAVDISYIDSKDNYKPKIEYVEDSDAIRQRGLLKKQINAFGITSRGQARRYGKHFLFQVSKENSNVTFTTDMRALLYKPGDLIRINDEIYNSVKNFGTVKQITNGVDSYSFNIVIDKILDSSIYLDDQISLYTPTAKPKYDDFYYNAQNIPTYVSLTLASPFLGITNRNIVTLNGNSYNKTSEFDSYYFKMYPYEDGNLIKTFSTCCSINYNYNSSTASSFSASEDVVLYLKYNEAININNQPSKYGHWELNTGENGDKILFDILQDESLKFELSIKNYFFEYFDTGKYLKVTGVDFFGNSLYETFGFDPRNKNILFKDAYRNGSFCFQVDQYQEPSISYYEIIENNKPSIETFYITNYTTGSYVVDGEIQSVYSELCITKSGKNESVFTKIKNSVAADLNQLSAGSPYSLKIRDKKDKIFKINSITENYVNEYNLFATEYNINKFNEIEENASLDDMRDTFNFLNAHNESINLEDKNQILSPIILSTKHVKYNFNSEILNYIELKWTKVVNANSFNIYIRTPSKQTSNFQLNVLASEFNSQENCYIKLIPLNNSQIEVGTYYISIEALSLASNDGSSRSSSLSNSSISILYY